MSRLPDRLAVAEREIKAHRKADRAAYAAKISKAIERPTFQKRADKGRQEDPAFIHWLHVDIPCIACLILGPAPAEYAAIEAAHQRHVDTGGATYGRRVHDRQCCPLCTWHHRQGPLCCDPAQVKFWAILRVNVGDFCRALHDAFKAGQPGEPVVRAFASNPPALVAEEIQQLSSSGDEIAAKGTTAFRLQASETSGKE